jgi:hypothetical protein
MCAPPRYVCSALQVLQPALLLFVVCCCSWYHQLARVGLYAFRIGTAIPGGPTTRLLAGAV